MVQELLHVNATRIAREISSYGVIFNWRMINDTDTEKSEFEEDLDQEEQGICTQIFRDIDIREITGKVIDNLFIKERMYHDIQDIPILNRCIRNGYDGILFYGSSLFDEEECVTIRMAYRIQMPVLQKVFSDFPVIQKIRIRSFNGYAVAKRVSEEKESDHKESEEQEKQVYITKTGSVYHTNRNCTHLCISLSEIPSSFLSKVRNSHGGIYDPCEVCFHHGSVVPGKVYITKDGDCYHKNASCYTLQRYISSISLSEISGRRLCKRCQSFEK